MNLRLEKINKNHISVLKKVIEEYERYNEDYEGAFFLRNIRDYNETIKKLEDVSNGVLDNPNFAAYTCYLVFDSSNNVVGLASLRHYLNDFLINYGGHVGYSILPSKRNNGYGTMTLKLLLDEAKKININKLLVVCKKKNLPSKKVIENNNGVLDNEVIFNNDLLLRYWIDLNL